MSEQTPAPIPPTKTIADISVLDVWVFLLWAGLSLALITLFVMSPALSKQSASGLQLGADWPMEVLEDAHGQYTANEVAAMPETVFTWLHQSLNQGYTHSVYWLKVAAPPLEPTSALAPRDPLWLEVVPPYLDRVTLYQRVDGQWQEVHNGDTAPLAERIRVRQLLFPLVPDQPLLLRVQTSSIMHVHGRIWRGSDLLGHLARTEWAQGVHLGINLVLALLIGGTALALRRRSLVAMAVLALVIFVQGLNARSYTLLWLPESLAYWGDVGVRLGVFALPAAYAWQGRELFTQGTDWRRIDRLLVALAFALLLAMLSAPTAQFAVWAKFAVFSPWLVAALCTMVAWTNMRRRGFTVVRQLIAAPYALHALVGLQVGAAYTGLVPFRVEVDTYWQTAALVLELMLTMAVGAKLFAQFHYAKQRQIQLVESLEKSEHTLEERVRQHTAELQQTQTTLQSALHRERQMRQEQRQFFGMVNHEFRTPLTVIDSAATEQMAFPTPALEPQIELARQVRRACRRLVTLMDNCLVSDRMDSDAFGLQMASVDLTALIDDTAQLVRWSRRHNLRLDTTQASEPWICDAVLMRIALSNLVDNAVKHSTEGTIEIRAHVDASGMLRLAVCDDGPGLRPEVAQRLFERGERDDHKVSGFGLGLWVARRIAQLHGGDIEVGRSAQGGACFALCLPCPLQIGPVGHPGHLTDAHGH